MDNIQKITKVRDPAALADARRAASLPGFEGLLSEMDKKARSHVRRGRVRRAAIATAASILVSFGGCIALGGAAPSEEIRSAEQVHERPSLADLKDAARGDEGSADMQRMARRCLRSGASGADDEWVAASIEVVAMGRVEGSIAYIDSLIEHESSVVSYWAATYMRGLVPSWRSDANLKRRIEFAIINNPTTGGR